MVKFCWSLVILLGIFIRTFLSLVLNSFNLSTTFFVSIVLPIVLLAVLALSIDSCLQWRFFFWLSVLILSGSCAFLSIIPECLDELLQLVKVLNLHFNCLTFLWCSSLISLDSSRARWVSALVAAVSCWISQMLTRFFSKSIFVALSEEGVDCFFWTGSVEQEEMEDLPFSCWTWGRCFAGYGNTAWFCAARVDFTVISAI